MTDAQDRWSALEKLAAVIQPDAEPTLSSEELEDILEHNKRASRWSAGVAVTLGDVIAPTVRNGHVYRVIQGGTLDVTEPVWPTGSEDSVVDGSASLVEAGTDFDSVFNLRGAIEEAATLKAIKSAELQEGTESKIHEQWKGVAQRFATPLVG